MKHGILAHLEIDSTTPVSVYTFAGAAAYQLHFDDAFSFRLNELPLPNAAAKHLANTGDRIYASGTGTVLLEGVEQ
ncbi:MAG: hypothetical protein BWK73_04855 [Thiothrix lacustris]|uniref:Uncharacterized protein n=1 Tax=Thiothrix lacustris TaxID=525917 RepID=A0A1Y1QXQ7_9GAMM|nr:MAG: hypothetical protein BWK73_04855 [Thiothrix lacustris]